jgi:hypothetical protein
MKISFYLEKDIGSTLPSVKADIEKGGGKFNGNEQSGSFKGKGIEGTYSIAGKTVNIIISKRPPMISDENIKEEILTYFRK